MLNSIFRKAGKYLIGLSERKPPAEAPPTPDRGRQFSEQAKRIASSRGAKDHKLLAGSIRFLDLDQIKRELGVNWGRPRRRPTGSLRTRSRSIFRPTTAMQNTVRTCSSFALQAQTVKLSRRACATSQRKSSARSRRARATLFGSCTTSMDVIFVDGDEVPLVDTIANSLRRVRDEAENAAKMWREHLLRTASIRYKPIWSPSKKVVALHRAVLDEDTGRRTMQRLSSLSSVDEMIDVLFELDCLILGHAAAGLHDLVNGGGRTQLIVPVNFNSLNLGTRRKRYLKLCADIPSAYRRFLLFEICDIPPGTPGGRVLDLIVPLNQNAHGAIIEASVSSAVDLVDSVGSAIMGVVTRADEFSGAVVDVSVRLNRYVTDLKARNMKVFLRGVNSPELVQVARVTGIDWMDGPCVAALTRELKTLYRWNIG